MALASKLPVFPLDSLLPEGGHSAGSPVLLGTACEAEGMGDGASTHLAAWEEAPSTGPFPLMWAILNVFSEFVTILLLFFKKINVFILIGG